MIKERHNQENELTDLRANTKKLIEATKAGNLKEVIETSKNPVSTSVTEEERRGKDEATLRLIERIRREVEEEEKMKTDVKQKPVTEEEVVTTSCGVHGFNLEINKVIAIKDIVGTKSLSERLSFKMEDGRKQVWSVQTVLTLDYKTLVSVYNKISKDQIHQRICSMRKEKATTDDLPTKTIVSNPTNKKIHFEPFYMMEFRDGQGQRRFFRMEDNLKTATNEDLRTLQAYLDDRVEDEHRFKLTLHRQLEQNLGKKPQHHHYHGKKHRTQ